jgi:hypothetical protein
LGTRKKFMGKSFNRIQEKIWDVDESAEVDGEV